MFDSSRYHRSLPFFIDLFSVVFSMMMLFFVKISKEKEKEDERR